MPHSCGHCLVLSLISSAGVIHESKNWEGFAPSSILAAASSLTLPPGWNQFVSTLLLCWIWGNTASERRGRSCLQGQVPRMGRVQTDTHQTRIISREGAGGAWFPSSWPVVPYVTARTRHVFLFLAELESPLGWAERAAFLVTLSRPGLVP